MLGSSSAFPIVIPDDFEEEEEQVAVEPPVAPGAEDGEQAAAKRPGWPPDGFKMEGYNEDDGTFQTTVCMLQFRRPFFNCFPSFVAARRVRRRRPCMSRLACFLRSWRPACLSGR